MAPGGMLEQRLPAEFTLGEFGSRWYYDRYPTFSWAWTWRRTLLFASVAVPYGALVGVIHGLYARDFGQGLAVGARAALAMLLLVALAPCLAAIVRHRGLPLQIERMLIVFSLAVGVLLAWTARVSATDYHEHLMGAHLTGFERLLQVLAGKVPIHSALERGADLATSLLVQAVGGGALALRSYLGEPQRWRDHAARKELDALRVQKLATEARLAVLQAQVAPHFLFNTLASVAAQIDGDPRRAAELTQGLAMYLRSTLPRLGQDGAVVASTLGAQFDICRRYLDVMTLRLPGRLTVSVHLPDELGGLPFPPLVLISLVENAVTHGIEPKRGAGHIALSARRGQSDGVPTLEVLVQDDGAGLQQGLLEGTGIANVRLQLAALFGSSARVTIESPLEGGVTATVSINRDVLQQ